MPTKRRLLVIDDDETLRGLIEEELSRRGFDVVSVAGPDAALARIEEEDFTAVLTDINLDGMTGLELCERTLAVREDTPVIVMTAFGTMSTAIEAIRAGAYDFIVKPFEFDALALVLERAAKLRALRAEVAELRGRVAESPTRAILGDSAPVARMMSLVTRVAESQATVLIHGESGTGKELAAKAIHAGSERQGGPFIAINCAAMPETLLESELFGHAKGAFTDARAARAGLIVKASRGTLFLDEIGEMPLGMQAKLLRALQERAVRPVGGDAEVPFDARVVAATHRDLEVEVEAKRFREDLYYRINVVRVDVPPLRMRGNDILVLAAHFLERFAASSGRRLIGITPAVAERLLTYPWPGNVRELQNCIERAVALARAEQVALEDLPAKIRNYRLERVDVVPASVADPRCLPSMETIERRYIRQVLDATSGNKGLAAQILGFDRRTLYRKLEKMADDDRVHARQE
jgi:two-component system response regulator HydG